MVGSRSEEGERRKSAGCGKCEKSGRLLECATCPRGYHPSCLTPPISSFRKVPKARRWTCPRCCGEGGGRFIEKSVGTANDSVGHGCAEALGGNSNLDCSFPARKNRKSSEGCAEAADTATAGVERDGGGRKGRNGGGMKPPMRSDRGLLPSPTVEDGETAVKKREADGTTHLDDGVWDRDRDRDERVAGNGEVLVADSEEEEEEEGKAAGRPGRRGRRSGMGRWRLRGGEWVGQTLSGGRSRGRLGGRANESTLAADESAANVAIDMEEEVCDMKVGEERETVERIEPCVEMVVSISCGGQGEEDPNKQTVGARQSDISGRAKGGGGGEGSNGREKRGTARGKKVEDRIGGGERMAAGQIGASAEIPAAVGYMAKVPGKRSLLTMDTGDGILILPSTRCSITDKEGKDADVNVDVEPSKRVKQSGDAEDAPIDEEKKEEEEEEEKTTWVDRDPDGLHSIATEPRGRKTSKTRKRAEMVEGGTCVARRLRLRSHSAVVDLSTADTAMDVTPVRCSGARGEPPPLDPDRNPEPDPDPNPERNPGPDDAVAAMGDDPAASGDGVLDKGGSYGDRATRAGAVRYTGGRRRAYADENGKDDADSDAAGVAIFRQGEEERVVERREDEQIRSGSRFLRSSRRGASDGRLHDASSEIGRSRRKMTVEGRMKKDEKPGLADEAVVRTVALPGLVQQQPLWSHDSRRQLRGRVLAEDDGRDGGSLERPANGGDVPGPSSSLARKEGQEKEKEKEEGEGEEDEEEEKGTERKGDEGVSAEGDERTTAAGQDGNGDTGSVGLNLEAEEGAPLCPPPPPPPPPPLPPRSLRAGNGTEQRRRGGDTATAATREGGSGEERGRDVRADPRERSRARFLSIARSRAAYFAHYQEREEEEEEEEEVVGVVAPLRQQQQEDEDEIDRNRDSAERDWPGPFSTARRVARDRAQALRKRRDQGAGGLQASSSKRAPPPPPATVVQWVPKNRHVSSFSPKGKSVAENGHGDDAVGSTGGCRRRARSGGGISHLTRGIPLSLFDLCVEVLCDMADGLGSLYGMPDVVRKKVCAGLCARRKMTPEALRLFFDGEPSDVYIGDCTLISEDDLSDAMARCSGEQLEHVTWVERGRDPRDVGGTWA
ncbi:hypothetical protein CBR_g28657 [Chara braunii]|uniref:PHD-type domain-containing protein n=1 Tax=Chara braunii TaxID=69332 RepID=A0A388L9N6_CHABU|nr:hypothetical protein CBR_g28657 [Chara braunii]|eukprot:GBG78942.1 hypothetical protein CBR_g28657 [Chara braunii]